MGYNTYDAIGAGFDSFLNSALRVVEFADRRKERQQRDQELQQKQQAEQENQLRLSKQANLAADAYTIGAILNGKPGQYVDESMRAVINRHYKKYPDFKKIQRNKEGILLETSKENPFTLPDGSTSTTLELTQDQLTDMKNRAVSLLDVDGHAFLGKLSDSFRHIAGDGVRPTERADALSMLMRTSREMEQLYINDDNYNGANYEQDKQKQIAKQLENIVGVDFSTIETPSQREAVSESLSAYEDAKKKNWFGMGGNIDEFKLKDLNRKWALTGKPMAEAPWVQDGKASAAGGEPAQNTAMSNYKEAYDKFSSGGGLFDFNLRGIGEGEAKRLDDLWALTGQPMKAAPHRRATGAGGEPASRPANSPAAVEPASRPANSPAAVVERPADKPQETLLMRSPDGTMEQVPVSQITDKMRVGYRKAADEIPNGYVLVETPDGQRGIIPAGQAQEYIRYGARVVKDGTSAVKGMQQ